jgi:hypothetical protein
MEKKPMTSSRPAVLSVVAMVALLVAATEAVAQSGVKIGTLSCDVSRGVGLFVVQKQTLTCQFQPDAGGPPDLYTGQISEYGIALGQVNAGHLIWGVLAPSTGVPKGALAGTYAGVGVQASAGVGAGANVLIGGTGRSFSLQPLSVEGQTGVNIAGGITTVSLVAAP